MLAVSISAMGFLFRGRSLLLTLATVAAATALPWLLALLFSRELVVAFRARRAAETRVLTGSELR